MKLKNFLIICLVFSFFMAAAVIPAVAEDFDAEVFMITDFNENVNEWPSTKNIDATTDIADFSTKAAVSTTSRDVHVAVEGYSGTITKDSVTVQYYGETATGLILPGGEFDAVLRNSSPEGADFTITELVDESWVKWIRVVIRDEDFNDPEYFWAKFDNSTAALLGGTFTPDATDWNNAAYNSLILCNSLNLTLTSAEAVYLWWKNSSGDIVTQSTMLDTTSEFDLTINEDVDPNFTISYTNARYEDFNEIEVKFATPRSYYDDTNQLNLLTAYVEGAAPDYLLLIPFGKGIDADDISNDANVYYEGAPIAIDGIPSENLTTGYWEVKLDNADLETIDADVQENWTKNNSQVAVQMPILSDDSDYDNDNLYVAGPDDGVGPRLLSASLSYDDNQELTLTFSEPIDASLIDGDSVDDDIEILGSINNGVATATVSSADSSKIIVTTDRSINANDPLNPVTVNIKNTEADNIKDLDGNPAYRLHTALKVTVERVVDRVAVVAVDQGNIQTKIQIQFDKSMMGNDVTDDGAYNVELVDGLVEDPNGYADVLSVAYTDSNMIATITVDGVIESTAEADLPGIMIVKDIMGGPIPATVRQEDLNVMKPTDDEIGPYLVSAVFDYNGIDNYDDNEIGDLDDEDGVSALDLILGEKVTLTLVFSENVRKADEEVSKASFAVGAGFAWSINTLHKADVSPCVDKTVTINLDDDADDVTLPYSEPAFAENNPTIKIDIPSDIKDALGNPATDPGNEVDIEDGTAVWPVGAEIKVDAVGNTVINVEFGKNIVNTTNSMFDNKIVEVAGDPNFVADLDKSGNVIEIELIDEDDRATDWTPTVTFNLDEDNAIEDATAAPDVTDNDMTNAFDVVPADKVPPVLINIDPNGPNAPYLPAVQLDESGTAGNKHYTIVVRMEFSEPINPDVWAEPDEAAYFFENNGVGFDEYEIIGFVTDGAYACDGSFVGVEIDSNNVELSSEQLKFQIDTTSSDRFEDLGENLCADNTIYTLKTSEPKYEGEWDVPVGINVEPTTSYMMIQGEIKDPNGVILTGTDQYVLAVSRYNLFKIFDPNDDPTLREVELLVDATTDIFGATAVQDDGTYHMYVYEEDTDADIPGFKDEEPIILLVADTSAGTMEIATTACLSNEDYSIPFRGQQTPEITNKSLNLQNREVITLSQGWNLISTSIAGVYVDSDRCAYQGVDTEFYSNYIFDPDMEPADVAEYALSQSENEDISALLFTISTPDLNNLIFIPISDLFNEVDSLSNSINKTPVFGPGLGYYVYVDADHAIGNWQIVLFGEQIPGADYLVAHNSYDALVGHWGNMLYRTSDAELTQISKALLPSTYDDDVYVDDISKGAASPSSADEFAITATDDAGETIEVDKVSTFNNNKDLYGPAVWFGGSDYYDNSSYDMILPGGASWVQIDPDANSLPFYVQYMKPAEEE